MVDQRRRQERAFQLRMAGMSFQEIADTPDGERDGKPLYASRGASQNAVNAAMHRRIDADTTDTMRDLTNQRYERLIRSLWGQAVLQKNLWAVDRLLKAMDQQARLVGTNAPVRQTVEVISESAIDAEIERLTAQLAERGAGLDVDEPIEPAEELAGL